MATSLKGEKTFKVLIYSDHLNHPTRLQRKLGYTLSNDLFDKIGTDFSVFGYQSSNFKINLQYWEINQSKLFSPLFKEFIEGVRGITFFVLNSDPKTYETIRNSITKIWELEHNPNDNYNLVILILKCSDIVSSKHEIDISSKLQNLPYYGNLSIIESSVKCDDVDNFTDHLVDFALELNYQDGK